MFSILYTWHVEVGDEEKFETEWHEGTEKIYELCGSLGASLHKATDGSYVAYALWKSKSDWIKCDELKKKNSISWSKLCPHGTASAQPVELELIDDQLKNSK